VTPLRAAPCPARAPAVLRPPLPRPAAARPAEAAFGRDDHRRREWREGFADRLLALAARVEVGGVDHLHAGFHRGPDERDVAGGMRETVGPETDSRQVDAAELHGRA